MIRKELLDTLELVRPALADDNLVPIFETFCFDQGTVYAYKDNLGIIAPCAVEETFAVKGKVLVDLLKASQAKEVELDMKKEDVVLTAGKSKMKLPYMPREDFLFEEPESEEWQMILDLDEDLLGALSLCLITASTDHSMPAFMGVTIKGGKHPALYSCDGDALSRYTLGGMTLNQRDGLYTVPNNFVEAVLRITKATATEGQLYVNDEWCLAELGNNFKIFGRVIKNDEPLDYEKQIKKTIKGEPTFIEIPDGLIPALNRARVVADPEGKATLLSVDGDKLQVNTDTHIGEVKDVVAIDGGHPKVEANVSAKLISRAISICKEFALFDNCTLYRQGESFMLLVANMDDA